MFSRDARDTGDSDPPGREAMAAAGVWKERRVAAWIGASIVIKGDLISSEDMTIAGRIEGDVTVREHTLVIAPRARIQGNVVARAVAVHGEVVGTITAQGKVEVGETGSVDGDITAPRMVVAEGAVLHGRMGIATASSRVS